MRTLIVFVLALVLAACATAQPAATVTGEQLAGTSWRLREPETPAGVQTPTLSFSADGRASGHAGCNQWFATVTSTAGGALRFSAIGTTRRMCEPAAMEVEHAYLAALGQTLAAERDDARTLRFIGGEAEQLAVFEAARQSA